MEFDASRIYDHEVLSFEEQTRHLTEVHAVSRGGYLSVANELKNTRIQINEAHARCNRLAWGHSCVDERGPRNDEEVQLAIASADQRGEGFGDRLQRAARECHSLRAYARLLAEAVESARDADMSAAHDRTDAVDEEESRAAFEAHEATERERRYQEWRAGR